MKTGIVFQGYRSDPNGTASEMVSFTIFGETAEEIDRLVAVASRGLSNVTSSPIYQPDAKRKRRGKYDITSESWDRIYG